ncbi:MAG TPA: PHP domain-containing protein, partial [Candidatus Acidoferrum sp.]|nr:PHP domain-containing protein [Candidatus Acidoferrum sp.]
MAERRAFIDLHCHTSASFDCLASPGSVVRAAAARGLTHLAITDHDRIDGALRARDEAPSGLTVIVGEEIRSAGGDLIAVFLERAVAPGRPIAETIAEVREQGGLVGIPHPFDSHRGSLGRDDGLPALVDLVDWIETHNARLIGGGNERAGLFAHERGIPGVAVSDAHSTFEVGVAYSFMEGDPTT